MKINRLDETKLFRVEGFSIQGRLDDMHNFCIEHFFIRGHPDKLSGTCSVSLGFELIHSDIRVFHLDRLT